MNTRKSKPRQRDYVLEVLGILSASVWLMLFFMLNVLPSARHCQGDRLSTLTPLAVICTALTATAFVVSFSRTRRSLPLICGVIGSLLLCSTVILSSDQLCESCASAWATSETVTFACAEVAARPSLSAWQLRHIPGPLGAVLLIATNLANSASTGRGRERGMQSTRSVLRPRLRTNR